MINLQPQYMRVWDTETEKMYFSHDKFCRNMVLDLAGNLVCLEQEFLMGECTLEFKPVPSTVIHMNHTGIYDKLGTPVFNGDIVEHDYFGIRLITWGDSVNTSSLNGMASFMYSGTISMLHNRDSESIEVVGNIYANPELLEL